MGLLEQMCTSAIVFVVCSVSEFPRKRQLLVPTGATPGIQRIKKNTIVTKLQTKIKIQQEFLWVINNLKRRVKYIKEDRSMFH